MPRYQLPKDTGRFRVVTSKAGKPLVINDKTGKHQIAICCRTTAQAEKLCKKLNEGDHNGEVWV